MLFSHHQTVLIKSAINQTEVDLLQAMKYMHQVQDPQMPHLFPFAMVTCWYYSLQDTNLNFSPDFFIKFEGSKNFEKN